MTPILVRPVREQLEHDRVIRLLQARWRRKYAVGVNVGAEQTASIASGDATLYPDLVLSSLTGSRKPEIVVEVETGESVNNLEAMAEWVRFGQLRAAFHLYVPSGSVDSAKRLCAEHGIPVAEICTFHLLGDQMRFTTVFKAPPAARPARRPRAASEAGQAGRRRPAAGASRQAAPARRRTAPPAAKKTAGPAARAQKRKS